MTLWRLEVLRLVRTHRWMIVFGVYGFFAVTGPLVARYFNEIIARFGGEVTVVAPEPRPVDGIALFLDNASQLGLLAVVIVGAGSLAVDARPEIAAFLRTRVTQARRLIMPRYVVTTGLAVAALAVGTAVAWALTVGLIGGLPASPLVVGTVYGALYLAFAVALVAAVAGYTRTQMGAVFSALLLLLAFPLLALVPVLRPWLPSELLLAAASLVEGASPGDFLRSLVVSIVSTAGLLMLATQRLARREI